MAAPIASTESNVDTSLVCLTYWSMARDRYMLTKLESVCEVARKVQVQGPGASC
jgi:hypothetical protein